jgi:transcription termination/antitermination protein NusG
MNARANTDQVEDADLQLEEAAVIEQDAVEADKIEGDIAIAEPDQVEPELIGETPELFPDAEQESVEESEATETPAPKGDGKRLSLKERLAARRQAELGEEPEDQEGRWYVLHTYSGYENKVKKTIETRVESLDLGERVYEIIVPTQEEIEIKNGQRQTVLKKVFPGYVLVRMKLDDETWYALRNTPGVTGFVNVDNKPVPLDESRVQSIMKGMVAEAPKVKVTFALGDTVRITDGPFAEFRGEIDEINHEKGKIRVLVSFFGRETPVELDFLQVERET